MLPLVEQLEGRQLLTAYTATGISAKAYTLHDGDSLTGSGSVGSICVDGSNVRISGVTVKGGKAENGIEILANGKALKNVTVDRVNVSGFTSGCGLFAWTWGEGTIDNLRVTNSSFSASGDGLSTWAGGGKLTNFYCGDCKAFNNAGNKSSDPTGSGFEFGGISGGLAERLEAWGNGAKAAQTGQGIWAYESDHLTIRDSYSHDNTTSNTADGGGFGLDSGCTYCVIDGCRSANNAGAGYGIYQPAEKGRVNVGNVVKNSTSVNDGLKNGYGAVTFWADKGAVISSPTLENLTLSGSRGVVVFSGTKIVGAVLSDVLWNGREVKGL